MRPDYLAIYVFLCEAQRLSKIKPWRRFKPAVIKTVHVLVTQLPAAKPISAKLEPLADIWRRNVNVDDVYEVARDLGLQNIDELAAILKPWLHDIFRRCLEWHDDGGVTAAFGETRAQTLPLTFPFDELGRLEGEVAYDDQVHCFHRGHSVPSKRMKREDYVRLIDSVEDDREWHAALVDHFGVEAYLLESKSAHRAGDEAFELIQTDRYAMIRVDGVAQRCPLKLDLEGARVWLRAQTPLTAADMDPNVRRVELPQRVPADPADEAVANP